ncbi:hypothetical protein FRC17_009924 [Serendipita sp. 399]|nr:hypothetical protein FRC17_009924 [Serendipita sp. 399]
MAVFSPERAVRATTRRPSRREINLETGKEARSLTGSGTTGSALYKAQSLLDLLTSPLPFQTPSYSLEAFSKPKYISMIIKNRNEGTLAMSGTPPETIHPEVVSSSLGNIELAESTAAAELHVGMPSTAVGGAIGGALCGLIVVLFIIRLIYIRRSHRFDNKKIPPK